VTIPHDTNSDTLETLMADMRLRLDELLMLQASPDMYGSETLEGQVVELEMWIARVERIGVRGTVITERSSERSFIAGLPDQRGRAEET
jgi:hypothetical protein